MKSYGIRTAALGVSCLLAASCVDHRPIRNGLRDESIYLTKADLTRPNPKLPEGTEDDGWLYRINVVAVSSPNITDAFPGGESTTRYVKFRFREDALQVIDGQRLEADEAEDPYVAERVLVEFPGQHVDVKLRESLDGERTNFLEENTEEPWQERQKFRVDFEQMTLDPEDAVGLINGYFLKQCARPVSSRLVPDSFQWDEADQYLTFKVEVNYAFDLRTISRICYSWAFLGQHVYDTNVIDTGTIVYKFNFYRRGPSTYQPEYVGEKDPVNKKYGVFQQLNLYTDEDSGLLGAERLIKRWNPDRPSDDPVVYYFAKGFPEKFKDMFIGPGGIQEQTNAVLEAAGASLRVAFREWNDGGIERELGDIRYSFVAWYDNQHANGPLGYGPSTADPRTGEIFSANVNAYNYAYDLFRFLTEEYLEDVSGFSRPAVPRCEQAVEGMSATDPRAATACEAAGCIWEDQRCTLAWEEIECAPGSTAAPGDEARCRWEADAEREACTAAGRTAEICDDERAAYLEGCLNRPRLGSALFNEMRFVMNLPEDRQTGAVSDFVPKATSETFQEDLHRILPEIRYGYPAWNAYVFHTAGLAPVAHLGESMVKEVEFQQAMRDIMLGKSPFGPVAMYTREGIEAMNGFREKFREWRRHHERYVAERQLLRGLQNIYDMSVGDFLAALSRGARRCVEREGKHTWESDEEFKERFLEGIIYQLMLHEFGHTLGLRHNFYGTMDAKHMREGEVTASVMDYVSLQAESGAVHRWGAYDEWALKWIYGTPEVRAEAMQQDPLYCTDEHRILSPLCRAYDFGTTPAEIVLNEIESYDWNYEFRNRRAYRHFWDTGSYTARVYNSIFPLQRMWYLALFDWGGGGVQDKLKLLDQVEGKPVQSQRDYDERAVDFYNDLSAAINLTVAFYDAVINQSASFRNYQTEFDPYYGDIRRIGIIIDKLYTTFAFMDLQDVYYSPNISTYVAMYDAPFGTENYALSQRVLDNMLGSNYDTFPWFRYLAVNIFAAVTNTNLVGSPELKERIAIWRFNNAADLYERFPAEVIEEALHEGNTQQTFMYEGEEYVYTYLPDRSWHLVAGKSRSPVSYQFMRDYNEALNGSADDSLDNYGLKILLAYHEYYNNFVGF